jgi:hypothetical protein
MFQFIFASNRKTLTFFNKSNGTAQIQKCDGKNRKANEMGPKGFLFLCELLFGKECFWRKKYFNRINRREKKKNQGHRVMKNTGCF